MGRREENKQRKREAIEDAGLSLFLEQGYERASIEQIAVQAGIARGTFYLYFASKLALFEALSDVWFEPLLAVLNAVQDRLENSTTRAESLAHYQDMAVSLAMLALTHRDQVLLAFRESRSAHEAGEAVRRREGALRDASVQLTEVGVARGLITASNPRLTTLVILGAIERLYFEFLTEDVALGDPMTVAGEVVAMLGRMLELPTSNAD
jgi:AcrR family transcriptional regulator